MVVSENQNQNITIRIHDDYCDLSNDENLACANRILSESHRRRQMIAGKSMAVDGFTRPKKLT